MYVQRNVVARYCNHCCSGKAISITYSQCVSVALCIQHAMCMPHIIVSSAACPALPYISTLFHKRPDFRKKKIESDVSFDFLYNFCLKLFSF
jgi:hypothetical protein